MPNSINQKEIFVDVDGTLLVGALPNTKLIDWLRVQAANGYTLTLWSARGEAYAREMADWCSATDLFHNIISKPGLIVDDHGWQWITFAKNAWRHYEKNLNLP